MLFVSTKTFKMLDAQYLGSVSKNFPLITKGLFSLNVLEILLEYIICSFLIFFLLRDKEHQFIEKKIYKKRLFLGQIITLLITLGLAFIIFFFIKITFILSRKNLYGDYNYVKSLIYFVFLHFNLCLLSSSIVYLFNMFIKDKFTSIILPIIFIQIPFILFGSTTIIISSILFPLKKVGEFINLMVLDKSILGLLRGDRIELLPFFKQLMIIILLLLLSVSCILIAYNFFVKINQSNLNKSYYFKGSKIFCHLNLSIIFSYLTALMLSFVIMFFYAFKGMDFASFIFSLLYLSLVPIYYIIQHFIYKKYSDIIIES